MKKCKYVIKTKREVENWIIAANEYAKSLLSIKDALSAFNELSTSDRIAIRKEFGRYDELRRKTIQKEEIESSSELSVMVDLNIIAADYNTNPLAVMMCVYSLCKPNEKVIIR